MITVLLIVHGLVAVALLGAITHQAVSALRPRTAQTATFLSRYSSVHQKAFTTAVAFLYVSQLVLGAIIYPAYRLNVRIPFEEMSLGWAVGIFELKEHFSGIGLCVLPLYVSLWRADDDTTLRRDRVSITLLISFIVWWDFLVGHILNNIRGLG